MPAKIDTGQVGDQIEVSAPGGELPRHGLIAEVIGDPRHARYRVRWLDGHESIHYPSDGTRIRARRRLPVVRHQRLPDRPDGTRRWRVELLEREPLEVELQAGERATLELTDDELHMLLPTALERAVEGAARDVPWDEPVYLYGDHFRG
jgi:hypothetical protein